jgi:hypothetical protein
MNLEQLKNKPILLFGKPRAFSKEEFSKELDYHKITLVDKYSEDVVLVIDGKMMTPYEQNDSDELYEKYSKTLSFISINELEKELVKQINPDTLLMSLKLSKDKDRLINFIKNTCFSDEIFFKFLKMYRWGGENFFDNNENRDVSAAIILRFYKDIEKNHNVEYATSGLIHLIAQTKNTKLIEMIFSLEPLELNYKLLISIAKNQYTSNKILKTLIKKSNTDIKIIISLRENCDKEILEALYETMNIEVHEALCYNANLTKEMVINLMKNENNCINLATYLKLDNDIFKLLVDKFSINLAKNSSIDINMQKELLELNNAQVNKILARNINIDKKTITSLLKTNNPMVKTALYENSATPYAELKSAYEDEENHLHLAKNISTPKDILILLSKSNNVEILKALSCNIETPVEVLYQLQLDARFARSVKENLAFGQHIQTQNLGWL